MLLPVSERSINEVPYPESNVLFCLAAFGRVLYWPTYSQLLLLLAQNRGSVHWAVGRLSFEYIRADAVVHTCTSHAEKHHAHD